MRHVLHFIVENHVEKVESFIEKHFLLRLQHNYVKKNSVLSTKIVHIPIKCTKYINFGWLIIFSIDIRFSDC